MGDIVKMIKAYEAKEALRKHKATKKRKEMLDRLKYMGRQPPDGPDDIA